MMSMPRNTSPVRPSDDARVLLFSQRNLNRLMYQCFMYEFEDVVHSVDRVDLLAPPSQNTSELQHLTHRAKNIVRKSVGRLPIGDIEPIAIERDYDLLFAVLQFPWQAIYLNRLKDWRRRCRKSACFLAESWTTMLTNSANFFRILSEVDYIFTHSEISAAALSHFLGKRCYCLPFAVDTERFSPGLLNPARSIDVLGIGRTSPGVHQALLELTYRGNLFYHFDTAQTFQVRDYLEHRVMLAELLKRSRFCLAYKHNVSMAQLTGGDEALAPRFFEAAAAGAVTLGIPPDCSEYRACFDWQDAIVHFPYEPDRLEEILSTLDDQPERLASASRNNSPVAQAARLGQSLEHGARDRGPRSRYEAAVEARSTLPDGRRIALRYEF